MPPEFRRLDATIPEDVIREVKNAPNRGIFNVKSGEVFLDRVLKCDEIVFNREASLQLHAFESTRDGWLAVCAKRWKFLAPTALTTISRPEFRLRDGLPGPVGERGPDGQTDGEDGNRGTNAPGRGTHGEAYDLPPLFLLGMEVLSQEGDPLKALRLALSLPGLNGGRGGDGGIGGRGGNGHKGNDGEDGVFDCKRGAGNGGRGGDGGDGGTANDGGDGGRGGLVIYAGSRPFLETITYTDLINSGGKPGEGGEGGLGGSGGNGGAGGNNSPRCTTPGKKGADGQRGRRGLFGTRGVPGAKGFADTAPLVNLNAFY